MSNVKNNKIREFLNKNIRFNIDSQFSLVDGPKAQFDYDREYNIHMSPTDECFVEVWKTCNNIEEFWNTLEGLWKIQHPNPWKPLRFRGLTKRATKLRRNGVELKEYPRSNWNPWRSQVAREKREKKYHKLNELAKSSL